MYYQLRPLGFLTPAAQIVIIAALFVVITKMYHREYRATGKISRFYPARTSILLSILFAPIYEEFIFRGFILFSLIGTYSSMTAVIISSLLFGLWHFKNIIFVPIRELTYQMLYTGLIFGPIMAVIALRTNTIWLPVILHYLNNIVAPYSQKLIKKINI